MSDDKQLSGKELLHRITWGMVVAVVITAGNVILSGGAIIQSQRLAKVETVNDFQNTEIENNRIALTAVTTKLDNIQGSLTDIKHTLEVAK